MVKKRTRNILLFFTLFTLLAGIIFYEFILPQIIADRYIRNLQQSAQAVRLTFEELTSAADTPLFNDQNAPLEKKTEGTNRLKTAIADSRAKLTTLAQTSRQLQRLPYTGYTGNYAKAQVLQKRTQHVLSQTDEALDSLTNSVAFLESYNHIVDTSKAAINDFNEVTNLATLIGKGQDMRARANQLRADAATLKNASIPPELDILRAPTYDNIVRAANGFDNLAVGLDAQNDAIIDAAAFEIEEAGRQLDNHHQTLYASTIQRSRTVKSIFELNEKLDVILP